MVAWVESVDGEQPGDRLCVMCSWRRSLLIAAPFDSHPIFLLSNPHLAAKPRGATVTHLAQSESVHSVLVKRAMALTDGPAALEPDATGLGLRTSASSLRMLFGMQVS